MLPTFLNMVRSAAWLHFFFLINSFTFTSHFRAYLIAKLWRTIQLLYFVNSVLFHILHILDLLSMKLFRFSKDNSCGLCKIEHWIKHTKDMWSQQLHLLFGSVLSSVKVLRARLFSSFFNKFYTYKCILPPWLKLHMKFNLILPVKYTALWQFVYHYRLGRFLDGHN